MIKVTIVVPVYNTEVSKLDACLRSVMAIKGLFECLIIDDGSEGFIKEYIYDNFDLSDKLRYVRKSNGGVSSARNLGITLAKGDYIMFVDSDDRVKPEEIEKQFQNDGVDLIISDLLFITPKRKIVWNALPNAVVKASKENIVFELASHGRLNGPVCKIIKKDFLIKEKISFDESMFVGEDALFFYKVLEANPSIVYVKSTCYLYYVDRVTSHNRIDKHYKELLDNYLKMYNELNILIDSLDLDDSILKVYHRNAMIKHIKLIFDYTLGLISNNTYLKRQKTKIVTAMNQDNVRLYKKENKWLGLKNECMYCLLKLGLWRSLKFVSFLRNIYIKIKY